jgi:phosphomannomutase
MIRALPLKTFVAAWPKWLANGIKVYLSPKAIPLPKYSFGVITRKPAGCITASHNPAQYNGFKIKSRTAPALPTNSSPKWKKISAAFSALRQ